MVVAAARFFIVALLVCTLLVGLAASSPHDRSLQQDAKELQDKIHGAKAHPDFSKLLGEEDLSHEQDEGFKAYREWKRAHTAGEVKHAFKGKIDPKHVHHIIRDHHKPNKGRAHTEL